MPLPPMSRDGRTTYDDPVPRRGPSSRPPPADRHQGRTRMTWPTWKSVDWTYRRSGPLTCLGELQPVLHVPLSDVSGTSGENGETLGSVVCVHGQSELSVICVLMILDAMAGDDVTHRTAVHGKKQRAEYRPLRNADVERNLVCLTNYTLIMLHD